MSFEYNLVKPSQQMKQVFSERTRLHRLLVQKNLLRMEGYLNLPRAVLSEVAASHDQSKLAEPERTAYIWMTWMYHCKNNGISFSYPPGVEAIVLQGWQHHLHHNWHHPEAHANLNAMSSLNIVEMVCDWTAISQEQNLKDGSCLQWAKANIDKKWNFSQAKKKLIFATIYELDQRNQVLIKEESLN